MKTQIYLFRLAMIVFLLFGVMGMPYADILLIHTDYNDATRPWASDVANKIEGTGLIAGDIDIFDAYSAVPTLTMLQEYDAVLVWSNRQFANPTLLGNVMADYVDNGGGVVLMYGAVEDYTHSPTGRWLSEGYNPLLPGGSVGYITPGYLGTIHDPTHPVLSGVSSFYTPYGRRGGQLNPDADVIADWNDGFPLIAELDTKTGGIMTLNFYPVSSDMRVDFWDATTDGDLLMANALNHVSAAVPEPASLLLLSGLGLGLILAKMRGHRSKE